MEYTPENKICQNCKGDFTIEPDDFGFYEKMNVCLRRLFARLVGCSADWLGVIACRFLIVNAICARNR
jgi:hypothetical protein